MFRLLRYFSITSALAILLVTFILSFLYWEKENTQLTNIIETQNVALAQSFANIIWPRYSNYVNSVSGLDGDNLRVRPETWDIHRRLRSLTKGTPILKIKMYDLNGLTIYSSEFAQIGDSKVGNTNFEATLADQQPHTKNSFRETFPAFEGEVKNRHLVESYIPIKGPDGELEGVFELYSDATPLIEHIEKTTFQVVTGLLLCFGALYGVLFLIVRHADNIMRRQLNDIHKAQEAATTANAAKSNFLATMSHEIRTPLNGVLGLAQLLMDTDLNKDQQKKVKTILSSGETLLAIINDVLDMSRIEAASIELEEKTFDLQDLVTVIATPFQSLIDNKGLELRVTYSIDQAPILNGDPVRLRQILWNLISNAIKFTEQGTITVSINSLPRNDVRVKEVKDCAFLISIIDTGPGIAPDRVNSIFAPFTQEDTTINRKHGGTGLGLTIVKQLTELMGGDVFIDSELGRGTRFDVVLPFMESTIEDMDSPLITTPKRQKAIKVLVAEDNDLNATIAIAFLKKSGCEVKRVENGKEAVDAAQEGWADLILMDIHMPEMNGMEATEVIKATDHGKYLPIIGLTAEAFLERHTEFLEAGMDDVLTKPFTEQQLNETLDRYREAS
ncbi:ATP-binding protein [Kiloniella spongiae]|uniref:ATP-binding protein n=1 Tax=Kiloniella spongiae TaxID=1489064 RepID=UPI00069B1FBD|nr:ATP-binding protein [Kiloniella spongiae]